MQQSARFDASFTQLNPKDPKLVGAGWTVDELGWLVREFDDLRLEAVILQTNSTFKLQILNWNRGKYVAEISSSNGKNYKLSSSNLILFYFNVTVMPEIQYLVKLTPSELQIRSNSSIRAVNQIQESTEPGSRLPFSFPCCFCKHSSDWSNYSQRSELPGRSSGASFQYTDQWDTSDFTHGRLFSAILISVVPPGCSSINRKSMVRLDWLHSCFHPDAERWSTSAPKTSPRRRDSLIGPKKKIEATPTFCYGTILVYYSKNNSSFSTKVWDLRG